MITASLREFVIIVVGVLVALGVDAGWAARSDAALEQEYLHQLRDDFEANQERLVEVVEVFRTVAESSAALAQASAAEVALGGDSINALIKGMKRTIRFEPQGATLRDLTGSGRMPLLRDLDLRRSLAEFDGWVSRLQERGGNLNDQWRDNAAGFPLELYELEDDFEAAPRRMSEAQWQALLEAQWLRNLAVVRSSLAEGTARDHEYALDIVEDILSRLPSGPSI